MPTEITVSSQVVATRDQVFSNLGGEVVILNIKSGTYFGLNPVGARIWDLIQEPISVGAIRVTLLAEYEVEAERCTCDLLALLRELVANELVEVQNGHSE